MFEHRLGLALGKSLAEVRNLPFDEFVSWKLYYKLEPWGWHDDEYRTAALLTQMWNTRVTKQSQAKKVKDYIRDMPDLLIRGYQELEREMALKEKMNTASKEDRKRMIAKSLGMSVGKAVKVDNGSGNIE